MWAIQRQQMILEENNNKLRRNKKLATHRLLQSITRMDYQCLNRPIRWEDKSGEHTGFYHPMDLMHFLIKNLDISSRAKLYQKLSIWKLPLPVLFPNEDQLYIDMSLRQVKIAWVIEGHIMEGNLTKAPIMLISMIRCGQQSTEGFSKSKLANDLFKFKYDPDFGSSEFFTKDSLSSNKSRKAAKGTVEGMWCEGKPNLDKFPASFDLLNLRGDALEHTQTAPTLASISDVVFMFRNEDMFKSDSYKNLFQEIAEKLKLRDEGEKSVNKLVVVFTKDAKCNVKENRRLFQNISKTALWEKVGNNYQKFLASMKDTIQKSSRESNVGSVSTLSTRLREENKESSAANIELAKPMSDSFIKMMNTIKNADEDQRSALRESLLPLQSMTKHYEKTLRKENRSLDIDKKTGLVDELVAIRKGRYEKIQRGLPEAMSYFLKELFNLRTIDQKLMFVCNIQYNLDDWCSNICSI